MCSRIHCHPCSDQISISLHLLNFAVVILGILLTSVGNSGPELRRSEEAVKIDGKTEGNFGQQYLDIIYLTRYKMTLEPNKLDLNELVGGQNET